MTWTALMKPLFIFSKTLNFLPLSKIFAEEVLSLPGMSVCLVVFASCIPRLIPYPPFLYQIIGTDIECDNLLLYFKLPKIYTYMLINKCDWTV